MVGSAKPLPELKKRALSPTQLSQPNNRLGAIGEQRAVQFLLHLGFQILDTNVQLGQFELDIVALDPVVSELVFVEVKTRSSDTFGHPSSTINYRKKRAWQKMALKYLSLKQRTEDFRFDVITVLPDRIEHFENITW